MSINRQSRYYYYHKRTHFVAGTGYRAFVVRPPNLRAPLQNCYYIIWVRDGVSARQSPCPSQGVSGFCACFQLWLRSRCRRWQPVPPRLPRRATLTAAPAIHRNRLSIFSNTRPIRRRRPTSLTALWLRRPARQVLQLPRPLLARPSRIILRRRPPIRSLPHTRTAPPSSKC